jgi:hypothetical protein
LKSTFDQAATIQEDLKPQTQDMKVPLAQLCIRDEVDAFLWSEVEYSRTARHLDIEPFGTRHQTLWNSTFINEINCKLQVIPPLSSLPRTPNFPKDLVVTMAGCCIFRGLFSLDPIKKKGFVT